jgi:hypothetical protein
MLVAVQAVGKWDVSCVGIQLGKLDPMLDPSDVFEFENVSFNDRLFPVSIAGEHLFRLECNLVRVLQVLCVVSECA